MRQRLRRSAFVPRGFVRADTLWPLDGRSLVLAMKAPECCEAWARHSCVRAGRRVVAKMSMSRSVAIGDFSGAGQIGNHHRRDRPVDDRSAPRGYPPGSPTETPRKRSRFAGDTCSAGTGPARPEWPPIRSSQPYCRSSLSSPPIAPLRTALALGRPGRCTPARPVPLPAEPNSRAQRRNRLAQRGDKCPLDWKCHNPCPGKWTCGERG